MEKYQIEKSSGFAGIMGKLKEGALVRRFSWKEGVFAVMQIPQTVERNIVPNMTSLPPAAKTALLESTENGSIHYHDQVLLVDTTKAGGSFATYYIPTWEDIFSDDWTWRK